MPIPLEHLLIFSTVIFLIGAYGALTRRNLIGILISIELILNSVNVNLIVFSRLYPDHPEMGQVFAIFIITLAATAAAVGLAIVLALSRVKHTIFSDEVSLLKW